MIKETTSEKEKNKMSEKFWHEVYELMIEAKLQKSQILKALDLAFKDNLIQLRPSVKEFLTYLNSKQVPVIIFSASGLGTLAISEILLWNQCDFKNISIISNQLKFDENGYFMGVDGQIIHSENKTLQTLLKNPQLQDILNKNYVVLGNDQGDLKMGNENSLFVALDSEETQGYDVLLKKGDYNSLLNILSSLN